MANRGRYAARPQIPDHVWHLPAIREALFRHDFKPLFTILNSTRGGALSQTVLASMTGLSQSVISQVINGSRQLRDLVVICRLADGLSMPNHARDLLGIAAEDEQTQPASLKSASTVPARPIVRRNMPGSLTLPSEFWKVSEVVEAVEKRDIPQLFCLVQRNSRYSQTDLGGAIGLSQPQISEIMSGRGRKVTTIDVLNRIIEGLNIPDDTAVVLLLGRTPDTTKTEPDKAESTTDGRGIDRRHLIRDALIGGAIGLTAGAFSGVDPLSGAAVRMIRRQIDEMLSATPINDSTVSFWDSVADGYGRSYRTSSPPTFLTGISRDMIELHALTNQRLPTAQRRGLCHATARMAGLVATTFVNLNDFSESRAWFHTAQLAAQESEDATISAWVMVRHAISALYWNDPHGALKLATQASALVRGIPCVATSWAPAVQARALARLGQAEAARSALTQAETEFTRLEAQTSSQDAYGYTAAQLHFYRSNALTEIGDTAAAYEAQTSALGHYGSTTFLDSSLVRMDRAICLVKDSRLDEAIDFATRSLEKLPNEHVSPIILRRAEHVITAIPPDQRRIPAVRQFHERLALPASA